MNTIKELFDSSKDINRRIESVVTFADNSEENLKNEINEYVVITMRKLSRSWSRHFVIPPMRSVCGYPDSMVRVRAPLPNIWDILFSNP